MTSVDWGEQSYTPQHLRASLRDSTEQQMVLLQVPRGTEKRCSEALSLPSTEEEMAASEKPSPQMIKTTTPV